jgi:predicted nicotinamide N-methyase
MLIIYELVDWKTIAELIAPWPPEDQEKIIDYLVMLGESRVMISEEEVGEEESESGLSPHLGKRIHINVENHHNMLRDYVRTAAYRRAIEQSVKPGDVVLDLGCGSGVLGFFAAQAGASKVYAIERRPDVILLAEELANANGLTEKMDFIQGSSSHVQEARLTPKPDVLVSEILGNGILEENILEYTLDARDRFLKPGGIMLPYGIEIYIFAFDSGIKSDKRMEVDELKNLYGLDFSLLGDVLCQKTTTRMEKYSPYANTLMSEPQCIQKLDFRTLNTTIFEEAVTVTALRDGEITSFCGYFNAQLNDENNLTNSPWAPNTHWTNISFTLPKPIVVTVGQQIQIKVIYDGALRIQVE